MERRLIQLKQIDANFTGDKHYSHEQRDRATIWTVNHNLGKYPTVHIYYMSDMMHGKIRYISDNSLEIEFCMPCKGMAICN